MAMRAWMPVVAAVAAGLWATSAQSPIQPSRFRQAWLDCTEGRVAAVIHEGCSVVLVSGRLSDADSAVAYLHRGHVVEGVRGEWRMALADFSDAIRLNPSYAEAYAKRGYLYFGHGLYDLARADLAESRRLNPSQPALTLEQLFEISGRYPILRRDDRAGDASCLTTPCPITWRPVTPPPVPPAGWRD